MNSELSQWEKLRLECAIAAQFNDNFNCFKCLQVRKEAPEINKGFRLTKGCFGKKKEPIAVMDNGTKLFICIGRLYSHQEIIMIDEYSTFKSYGILPNDKPHSQQSSKLISSFNFIESEINKNQAMKQKEAEAKNG